ncbi:TniB family NTP-binding protein [Mycobacterium sp.]|uniref:TniB family NTP-binding protein n=1 Tax=Mycobacterium sp. TaxID=1785 RepID=UPI003D1100AF
MDSRRWHDWCTAPTPEEPPPLTLQEWGALNSAQRRSQIDHLKRWLHQHYFTTAQFDVVTQRLNTIIERNAQTPPGAKEIPVITGPNTIGKSVFIKDWARQRYLHWTASAVDGSTHRPVWYPTPDVECDFCPVVFINLQADAQTKALDSQILGFYGLPSGTTAHDTTRSAMKALARHQARVVVIDDVNLLKTEWRGARKVLDHIKFLNTELGESAATLVLVGANLIGGELLNDPQIKGRSTTFAVTQYEIDEPDEQRVWQRVIRDVEQRLLPHLPAGRDGMLYRDLAGELWFRTQGYFQDLKQLICEATLAATNDGTHAILRHHLDGVTLSDRAEAARHAMMDRNGALTRPTARALSAAPNTATPPTAQAAKLPAPRGKARQSRGSSRTRARKPA